MIYGNEKVSQNPCETCALGCMNGDQEVSTCVAGLRTAHRNWHEGTFGEDKYYPCAAQINGAPAQEKISHPNVRILHNGEYSDCPDIVTAIAASVPPAMRLSSIIERTELAAQKNIPCHCLRVQESIIVVKAIPDTSLELSEKKEKFVKALQEYIDDEQGKYLASRYAPPAKTEETALARAFKASFFKKSSSL